MENEINKVLSDAVATGQVIGASCLVFKDGKEVFSGFTGYADREKGIPMQRDTICRLFSLSKPVTGAAAMVLMDKGLLDADMPVKEVFPGYASMKCLDENGNISDCRKEMTIRHLLSMTSGLCYANNYNAAVCSSAKLFDDLIERQKNGNDMTTLVFTEKAADLVLEFEPGTRWDYGISADVLAGVIEKLSGQRYGDFLKENIFEPLGMYDTGFFVPEEKRSRFAALYSWTENGLKADSGTFLGLTDYSRPPAYEAGGAGLVSTINDYSRFARMLTGGGKLDGVRIISDKTFRFMTTPQLLPEQSILWERLKGYNYSCLMRILTDPDIAEVRTAKGEFGWDGWTGTYFNSNNSTGITVLYFTQVAGAGMTKQAADISGIVYDHLFRK